MCKHEVVHSVLFSNSARFLVFLNALRYLKIESCSPDMAQTKLLQTQLSKWCCATVSIKISYFGLPLHSLELVQMQSFFPSHKHINILNIWHAWFKLNCNVHVFVQSFVFILLCAVWPKFLKILKQAHHMGNNCCVYSGIILFRKSCT